MSVKRSSEHSSAGSTPAGPAPRRPLNATWLRRRNAELLFRAVQREPGSSQRRLAEVTGLDKATVSTVVGQLTEGGLLTRGSTPLAGRSSRQGRPKVALDVPVSAGLVLGARMEPASIDVVAADLAGRILDRETADGAPDPETSIARLCRAVAALTGRHGTLAVHACGIGIPAMIRRDGRLLFGPNLGWRDLAIRELAARALDMPTLVENDTNAAAYAERGFGTCTQVDDFLYVTMHSGVGGALFLEGRLYRGATGLAGEIGHIKVVEDGRRCGCGAVGCLEAHVSEPAILQQFRERGGTAGSVAEMAELAAQGSADALGLLRTAGQLIGRALGGPVNLLNPDRIVLGGKFADAAPWMLETMRAELAHGALPQMTDRMTIQTSPIARDAVVMGGVALAINDALQRLLPPAASASPGGQ